MIKIRPLLFILLCCATAAAAAELGWDELVRRPELWPAQCLSKQTLNFPGGVSVQAGQKLNVIQFNGKQVEVGTTDGRTTFVAGPEGTDVLAVARAAYAALTPKQQELTYASLLQQKELWPFRVTLTKTIDLGGGQALHQGDQLRVLNANGVALSLMAENMNTSFNIAPQATDFMRQAWKFAEDAQAGPRYAAIIIEQPVAEKGDPRGPVIAEMDGKLVNAVTALPDPLDPGALPRFIVYYRGSSADPFTKGFTPTLVKYYREAKPRHPEFEIVYIMTESAAATAKFAKTMGFSWRALGYDTAAAMPIASQVTGSLLPQLIVMDRSGRVLISGTQTEAMNALRRLDALLNQASAQNRG